MAALPAGSFANLTDCTTLKRLSSLRFFPEWEGRLSHAVQNGVASLADLPPRALKAQAQTSFVYPLSSALYCDGTRLQMWDVLHLRRLCRCMLSDSGEILGLRPPSATTHVVTQPAQVAAALLGVEWPTPRWPLYVFLAGAMACLLTSATCHLLAACSSEVHAQSAMAMSPDAQDGGASCRDGTCRLGGV